MAETEDQRVAAGINQLVYPAGLEAAGDVDMRVRRDQRMLGALVVEANPAFDAGKAPGLGRHRDPRVVGIAAARQARLARVERYGRMTARRSMAAQRKRRDPGTVGDVLNPDQPGYRRHGREIEHHPSVPRQQVALPGEPDDRVAAPHQKSVPGMRQGPRVVRGQRVVEELQHPLVAAVAVVEKDSPVAAPGIGRLQDREIADKPDEPLGIRRRLVDVGDALLRRRVRLDGKMRPPDEPPISSRSPELMPVGKREPPGNRQFHPIGHTQTPLVSLSWPGLSRFGPKAWMRGSNPRKTTYN